MRTTLTVAGVALAGTALGVLTYSAVSAPTTNASAASTSPTGSQSVDCPKPAGMIGGYCTSVVHVGRNGATTPAPQANVSSASAASTTSQSASAAVPVVDSPGDFDDDGSVEAEDRADDAADEAEDRADDRADKAEDD